MPQVELLERIASDLDFLKKKVVEIEESVEDYVEIILTREEFERLPPKNKPPGELGVRIEGVLVYMGQYLDEKHTATPNGTSNPSWRLPLSTVEAVERLYTISHCTHWSLSMSKYQ